MAEDNDLFEAVLHHCDIVDVVSHYITVHKAGSGHVALCPFHDDSNPSMQISKSKQIFKCFVCGEGGNAISFVSKFEKIPYREAMKKVAEISGYSDPRLQQVPTFKVVDESKNRLYKALGDLQTYYRYSLSIPEGEKAREYLSSRNLDQEIQERYGIGYAPKDGGKTISFLQLKKHSLKVLEEAGVATNNGKDRFQGRITFPIHNPDGQVIGFSARRFEEGQEGGKYVNSPESTIFHKGNILYNYHRALPASRIEGCCYLCEGFMDVIALHKAGIDSSLALMGTALTKEHASLLRKLKCEIRIALDGDGPGQEATLKTANLLHKENIPFKIVDYQGDTRDPDEILNQEGKDALLARLNRTISAFDFTLNHYRSKAGEMDKNKRMELVMRFIPYLASTKPGLEYEDLLSRIAEATLFHKDAIREIASKGMESPEPEEAITYYVRGRRGRSDLTARKDLSRLVLAEKMLLHYMLENEDALEFFKANGLRLNGDPIHEEIASYLIEFASSHPGKIVLSEFEGYIAEQEEGQDEILNALSAIALEENYPPFEKGSLSRLASTIREEKEKIAVTKKTQAAIRDGDDKETAAALKAYSEAVKNKYRKSKKKGA